jgi:hypothetical protein
MAQDLILECCFRVYSPIDIKGLIYHDDRVKAACQLHIRLGLQLFETKNPLPSDVLRIFGRERDPQAAMLKACYSQTSVGQKLVIWGHSTASSSPLLHHQEGTELFRWFDPAAPPQRNQNVVRRPEPIRELPSTQYDACFDDDSEFLLSSIQNAL